MSSPETLESIKKKERRKAVRQYREAIELWIRANDELYWASLRIAELEKLLYTLAKNLDQNQAE